MEDTRGKELFGVYVKTNENHEVLAVHSNAFLAAEELEGWAKVDEGEGLRCSRAENFYVAAPLYSREGLPACVPELGNPGARTAQEVNPHRASFPPPPLSFAA